MNNLNIRKVSFKAIRPTAELATHDVHDTFILVGDKEFRVVQSYTSAKKNFQQQQQLQQSISEDSATLSQASALNYTVKVLKCIENSKFSFTIIKQFRSQTKNQIDLEEMRHELNILKKCQSPNVIRLIDSFTSDHVINMQLEYGETNFESIIRENHNLICKAWIPHYFYNIVNAVAHLHTLSIVHLDIKPENFVQVIGTLKLIDFGISREITGDNDYVDIKTCEGTLRYMSPEQIVMHQGLNVRRITVKSDVWSMGCILYRMVFGSLPFDSDSDENIIANIISCNYKISYAWNEKVVDIIKKCLEIDPKRRVASIQMLMNEQTHMFNCLIGQNLSKELKVIVHSDENSVSLKIDISDLNTDEIHSGNFSPKLIDEICKKIGQKLSFESFLRQFVLLIKQMNLQQSEEGNSEELRGNIEDPDLSNNFQVITFDTIMRFKRNEDNSNGEIDSTSDNRIPISDKSLDKIYLLFSAKSDEEDRDSDGSNIMNIPLALNLLRPKNMLKVVETVIQSCGVATSDRNSCRGTNIACQTSDIARKDYSNFEQQFTTNLCDDIATDSTIGIDQKDCCKKFQEFRDNSLAKIERITRTMTGLKEELKKRDSEYLRNEEAFRKKIKELQKTIQCHQSIEAAKNSNILSAKQKKPIDPIYRKFNNVHTKDQNLSDDSDSSSYSLGLDCKKKNRKIPAKIESKKRRVGGMKNIGLDKSRERDVSGVRINQYKRSGSNNRLNNNSSRTVNVISVKPKLYEFEDKFERCSKDDIVRSPKRIARRNPPFRKTFNATLSNPYSSNNFRSDKHNGSELCSRKKRSNSSGSCSTAGSSNFRRFNPTDYVNNLTERRARSFSLRDSRLERARSLSRGERSSCSQISSVSSTSYNSRISNRTGNALDSAVLYSSAARKCPTALKYHESKNKSRNTRGADDIVDIEERLARLQDILA